MPRAEIEPLLLGKVVVDQEAEAALIGQMEEVLRLLQRRPDEGEEV